MTTPSLTWFSASAVVPSLREDGLLLTPALRGDLRIVKTAADLVGLELGYNLPSTVLDGIY
jgi:hypothetical protein